MTYIELCGLLAALLTFGGVLEQRRELRRARIRAYIERAHLRRPLQIER